MLYTEERAKDICCPMVRWQVVEVDGAPALIGPSLRTAKFENGKLKSVEDHCIASKCMWWRWKKSCAREEKRVRHPIKYEVVAGTLRKIDGEFWRYQYTDIDSDGEFDLLHRERAPESSPRLGYCGIAGKP